MSAEGRNPEAGAPECKTFELNLEMIKAGVALYLAFDPVEDEPETLVADILQTAKAILEGKS